MLIVMQDVDPWPFVISRIRLRLYFANRTVAPAFAIWRSRSSPLPRLPLAQEHSASDHARG